MGKIRNILYKQKRKIYQFPRKIFQNALWEKNTDNLYYGHYHILKKYSKTILPYKINGELQHGWSPNHGIPSNPLLETENNKKKRYYLFNEDNYEKCTKYGYHNVKIIGAPFIYLPNIFKKNKDQSPKSLILFPLHSHEFGVFKNILTHYEHYIEEIDKIKHHFNFITVCLGWKEYANKEIVNLYKRKGAKVITMGHRENNPNFLNKFVKIVGCHEYLSSDSISSAIFYGLIMRKKVFLYGKHMGGPQNLESNMNWDGMVANYQKLYTDRYPELDWKNFEHKSHYKIGEKELGYSYKLSPRQMCDVFGWQMYKIL